MKNEIKKNAEDYNNLLNPSGFHFIKTESQQYRRENSFKLPKQTPNHAFKDAINIGYNKKNRQNI